MTDKILNAPKILIEELIRDENDIPCREIEVYCFNSIPKIIVNARYVEKRELSVYDEYFNQINLIFHPDEKNLIIRKKADNLIKQTFDLSKQLSIKFNFVRVDWLVFNKKIYFNELTFTPYSGFIKFNKKWNLKLGSYIDLKGL